MSNFADEVLEHLSSSQWKSAIELSKEISAQHKREGRRKLRYVLLKCVFGNFADEIIYPGLNTRIYAVLVNLKNEQCAEWRWRVEPKEALKARNGRRRMEWRLTQSGHRKQVDKRSLADPHTIMHQPTYA